MNIHSSTTYNSQKRKPTCPSADEQINKMGYIHTMEYYPAIKMNAGHMLQHGWTLQTALWILAKHFAK